MMRFFLVFILSIGIWLVTPFQTSDAYLQATKYDVVTIKAGDDLWSLADKYINDQHDIRQYLAAIYRVNGLQEKDALYPGQKLKFPIIK